MDAFGREPIYIRNYGRFDEEDDERVFEASKSLKRESKPKKEFAEKNFSNKCNQKLRTSRR